MTHRNERYTTANMVRLADIGQANSFPVEIADLNGKLGAGDAFVPLGNYNQDTNIAFVSVHRTAPHHAFLRFLRLQHRNFEIGPLLQILRIHLSPAT